jgi:hypothetical protein
MQDLGGGESGTRDGKRLVDWLPVTKMVGTVSKRGDINNESNGEAVKSWQRGSERARRVEMGIKVEERV